MFCSDFLKSLKGRGLTGIKLVISDRQRWVQLGRLNPLSAGLAFARTGTVVCYHACPGDVIG